MLTGLRRSLWLLILTLSSTLLAAASEPWPRALELFGPRDADGFVVPDTQQIESDTPDGFEEESSSLEEADESQSPVMVWSLNEAGFMHRGRRKATTLKGDTIPMPLRTRIYTGGAGIVALGAPQRFYGLILPSTSLHALQNEKGWRWTLLEDTAYLRLTCHGEAPRLRWKDTSDEIWRDLSLLPDSASDVLVIREGSVLEIYQLQGRSRFYLPSLALRPGRDEGYLRTLQDLQLTAKRDGRTRIELFPQQVLRLELKERSFYLTIGSADPDVWGARLLQSSPQLLSEVAKDEKPQIAAIRAFRLRILEEKTEGLTNDEATLLQLIGLSRHEEALHLLRRGSDEERKNLSENLEGLDAFLLYRLQQNEAAEKVSKVLTPAHPKSGILREEKWLAQLRSQSPSPSKLKDRIAPHLALAAPVLNVRERYQLGVLWQREEQRRSALDIWSLNAIDEEPLNLQKSREEWVDALLEDKRWFYTLGLSYGRDSNAPEDHSLSSIAPVASAYFRLDSGVERVLDRSQTHQVSLKLDLLYALYQAKPYSQLGLSQFNLSLPLAFEVGADHDLQFVLQPAIGRKQRGSAANFDYFAYDLHTSWTLWTGRFTQSLSQMQGLDPDPAGEAPLDIETGEKGFTSDQGLKTLHIASHWQGPESRLWRQRYGFRWSTLDYRSPLRDGFDRRIYELSGGVTRAWNLAWSSDLSAAAGLHHFTGAGARAKTFQIASQLQLDTIYRTHLRWEHYFRMDVGRQPSAVLGVPEASTIYELGSRFRW